MAQKTNKTKHTKKRLLEALEKSLGVVTSACKIADVSRWTYYDYLKNDEQFAKEVEEIQNISLDFSESKLFEAISKGNLTAVIFHLKTKGKHRGYVERFEAIYNSDKVNLPEWMDDGN